MDLSREVIQNLTYKIIDKVRSYKDTDVWLSIDLQDMIFKAVHTINCSLEEQYDRGYSQGYHEGSSSTDEMVYEDAFSEGKDEGYRNGFQEGKLIGYNNGFEDGLKQARVGE